MLSESQEYQLQILRDIHEVSCLCSTNIYVWGGLVIDILEGYFLREHHDIDCFTLNLLDVKNDMDDAFKQKGYLTEYISDIDMFKVNRYGCKVGFNRLEIAGDTAMWRHIGNEGTVYFPLSWLSKTPVNFYGIPILISGAEFEYAIKAKVKLLSPIWELRDKDFKALDYWTQKLRLRNVDTANLLRQIWSDNPYWRKKGYREY